METAKYKSLRKNGYASITFDGWHLNHVRPPMTEEEFVEFCHQNNRSMIRSLIMLLMLFTNHRCFFSLKQCILYDF